VSKTADCTIEPHDDSLDQFQFPPSGAHQEHSVQVIVEQSLRAVLGDGIPIHPPIAACSTIAKSFVVARTIKSPFGWFKKTCDRGGGFVARFTPTLSPRFSASPWNIAGTRW
jgi:hypothetical protein